MTIKLNNSDVLNAFLAAPDSLLDIITDRLAATAWDLYTKHGSFDAVAAAMDTTPGHAERLVKHAVLL